MISGIQGLALALGFSSPIVLAIFPKKFPAALETPLIVSLVRLTILGIKGIRVYSPYSFVI